MAGRSVDSGFPGVSELPSVAGLATAEALRSALSGVRALLLDVDGVLVFRAAPIPGSVEAMRELVRRGVPFRLVTNVSRMSRATLSRWLVGAGIAVPAEWIVLAASAAAAYTATRFGGRPLYVLAARDAIREFRGQNVLTHAQAARAAAAAESASAETAADPSVAAVVIGDAGTDFTFGHLDAAFRLVHSGAQLVAMHRNPWWVTPEGPTIDSGAFVRGLEFATGHRARIVGKPSAAFYRAALRQLDSLRPGQIAMVGDDLRTDIAPAHRLGLRTVLVETGRHRLGDVARAAASAGPATLPDAVAASLAEVVAALS